jgi:hypothetical protein
VYVCCGLYAGRDREREREREREGDSGDELVGGDEAVDLYCLEIACRHMQTGSAVLQQDTGEDVW